MRTHLLVGSIITLALVAGGTGCSSKVIQYKKGGDAQTTAAPRTGTYGLYKSIKRTSPRFTYHLNQGERVGFQDKDGDVLAVAGENEVNLGEKAHVGTYTWRVKK